MIPAASPSRLTLSLFAGCLALVFAGCASAPPPVSTQHLEPVAAPTGKPPAFADAPPLPKPPKPVARPEVYSVVVHNVNVQELLFALARDAKMNVDIHPGISGTVSMNVLDQTLTEILDRVARQVDMRYEIEGKNLAVMPDSPFLKTYRVDYPNIARNAQSKIGTSSSVSASSGGSSSSGGNESTTSVTNTSSNRFWITLIENIKDLLRETDKILPEGSSETTTEQTGQQTATPQTGVNATVTTTTTGGSGTRSTTATPLTTQSAQQANTVVRRTTFREAASVIANPETGTISVRATHRQHQNVREFIDRVIGSARRQVLIEATIVEVDLSDGYQQGIDWKRVASGIGGFTFRQNLGAGTSLFGAGKNWPNEQVVATISSIMGDENLSMDQKGAILNQMAPGFGTTTLIGIDADGNPIYRVGTSDAKVPTDGSFGTTSPGMTTGITSKDGRFAAAIRLLKTFGNTKVLSSPIVSVLNNQSAVLRVVTDLVYFRVTANTVQSATAATTTYTSTPETVPIGFIMSVIPQINSNNEITLTIRPTLTRLSGWVVDPNPAMASISPNDKRVPIVSTREMESILTTRSGDIAVLGGLIQDNNDNASDKIPGIGDLPLLGNLFKSHDRQTKKSELVVFLRPTIINDPSITGEFSRFRDLLPDRNFFKEEEKKKRLENKAAE